jgi:L-seryl-tRNA(Ser) seleniumtransferase
MTLAGMAEVLRLYRHPDRLTDRLPTLRHLTRDAGAIREQAVRLQPRLVSALGESYSVDVVDADSQVGSGSLPTRTIPSAAIAIAAADGEDVTRRLSAAFRNLPTPVIGYVHKGRLLLDLRCLDDEEGFAAQLETLRL